MDRPRHFTEPKGPSKGTGGFGMTKGLAFTPVHYERGAETAGPGEAAEVTDPYGDAWAEQQREIHETQKALVEELKRMNAFSASVGAINAREAFRFMGDLISLQQGQAYSQRRRTAGDGFALARLP